MEHDGVNVTSSNWCPRNNPKYLAKGLEHLEIRGQEGTIQIIALFRSARIVRGVLKT